MMERLGISMRDSEGNAVGLSEMVKNLTEATSHMTEADKVATLGKLVGTEAVSGFLALMKAGPTEIDKMSDALRNSAGASKKAAAAMKAGIGGALENLSGAFESLTITIGDQLVPYVQSAAKWLANLAEKFTNLSDGTKKFIVIGTAIVGIITALGAAIGITLMVVGGAITGIGAIGATLGIAGGAAGAFGAAFAVLTGPIGLAVLAIVAAGVAVFALVKHLKEDAIPEVDRFGEGVSKSTEKALTSFFELSDDASQAMADLSINSGIVTEEMKNTLVGKFAAMNTQIVEGMNTRHAAQLASMTKFFADSSVLTGAEEAKIIAEQRKKNEAQLTEQQIKEKRINEIIEAAYKEKRKLTVIEEATINGIKDEMNRTAVKTLSKSEMEQKVIFENMAKTAGDLSARQAADVVKNSVKARNGTIAEAKTQYEGTLAEIIRMRDETSAISTGQADKMIAEAKKSRDSTVAHAKGMHTDVVTEAKKQAGEHVDEVDWETGQIKSKWDILRSDLKTGWDDYISYLKNMNLKQVGIDVMTGLNDGLASMGAKIRETVSSIASGIAEWTKKALQVKSPSRVMMEIGMYTGRGLVDGMKGEISAVERMANKLAEASIATLSGTGGYSIAGYKTPSTSTGVSKTVSTSSATLSAKAGGITQNVTINSTTPLSPAETARKNKQAAQQLAMEWR